MNVFRLALACLALCSLGAASAVAAVKTETVRYQDGDVELVGHLAWDDTRSGKRPGVLVVHEWWGLNDYAKQRAEMLAELGYVALAVDMYGAGKIAAHGQDASEWSKQIAANVEAWQRRAQAGLDVLMQSEKVDVARVAAIGYCFGGATVMQMAYGGAPVLGVASFHGSLPPPPAGLERKLETRILVAHGEADGFIPPERIQAFKKGLERLEADYLFIGYGGAQHSFTNPAAGTYGMEGLRYDALADRRSWNHLRQFLAELFNDEL
jgi:dienelactone hydrolase